MRWSVGNSEWHGWHTNAYPLKFLISFRIVDSGAEAQTGFQQRQCGAAGKHQEVNRKPNSICRGANNPTIEKALCNQPVSKTNE